MQPSRTAPTTTAPARTGRRRAGVTGAAIAGLVAGGLGAPVAPAGAAPARPAAAQGTAAAATTAMDCANPTDATTVKTAQMVSSGGASWGTIDLRYSPTCRVVQAVASTDPDRASCTGGIHFAIKAWIVDPNGNMTHGAVCTTSNKAITDWVNDAGIQQAGKGRVYLGSNLIAAGQTAAF